MLRSLQSLLIAYTCLMPSLPAWPQSNDAIQSSSPDGAVITYHRTPPTFGSPATETWYKRGEAIRIDTQSSAGRDILGQRFTRPGQKVAFAIGRSRAGRLQSLYLTDGPLSALPATAMRTFTGAVEEHLGKRCRVWEVVHQIAPNVNFVRSGCVADDGIELWWRQANIGKIIATSITYETVKGSDVRPPVEALDLRAWIPTDANDDHAGDYRADLSGPVYRGRIAKLSRVKSGPWLSIAREGVSGEEYLAPEHRSRTYNKVFRRRGGQEEFPHQLHQGAA